jgi:hypothetical protein
MIYICLKLPRVDEYGVPGRRLGPVPERPRAVAVCEPLDAPEVLGAKPRPVRHPGADGLASADLGGHDAAAAVACHVVRVAAQRAGEPGGVGAGATEAVEEVEPERCEEVGDGGDPEPRRRAVHQPRRARRGAHQARRPAHLEAEGVHAVPHAQHGPRRRRRGQERLHALQPRPRRHGQERAERQVVGQHGVDVGGEELDAGEVPAVEQLGLPRLEPHDGRPPRGPEGVAEHRVHEHGRRAELGVAAAAGEEPHRRLVVLLRRHVRVLRPRLPEPLLHPVHQLLPDPLPPAAATPVTFLMITTLADRKQV